MVCVSVVLAVTGAVCVQSTLARSHDEPDPIVLWPHGAPNETKTFPPEQRTPDDGSGCGPTRDQPCDHIKDVSNPELIPYLVNNGTGSAVIIAPGGGYVDLAWSKEGIDVAAMYNSIGVSAFVLKYRVPGRPMVPGLPKAWAPLQDAQRALGFVRNNAAKFGLNSSQIGFTGFSAGGHLTAHISTTWQSRIYARVDENDDVSCKPDFSLFLYPWELLENGNLSQPFQIASELNVTADHPVSFFAQNEDDHTAPVQGAIGYYLKLLTLNSVTSSLHIYNEGGHGFALCQGKQKFLEVCDWPKAAQRFLQDHGFAKGWPAAPSYVN